MLIIEFAKQKYSLHILSSFLEILALTVYKLDFLSTPRSTIDAVFVASKALNSRFIFFSAFLIVTRTKRGTGR